MKIEHWQSEKDGLFYSHIVAGNGEVTHTSEGVHNQSDCLATIQSVRSGALMAQIVQIADPNQAKVSVTPHAWGDLDLSRVPREEITHAKTLHQTNPAAARELVEYLSRKHRP